MAALAPRTEPIYVIRERRRQGRNPDKVKQPLHGVYSNREDAEAAVKELNRSYPLVQCLRFNPFEFDWLSYDDDDNAYDPSTPEVVYRLDMLTDMPGAVLRDWMLEAGFDGEHEPPSLDQCDDVQAWTVWAYRLIEGEGHYDRDAHKWKIDHKPFPMTDDHWLLFWEVFPKYPFFQLVETTLIS